MVNKMAKILIDLEPLLYTVSLHDRLVHNLTLSQVNAITELYLRRYKYSNDPAPIVVYEQNQDSDGSPLFIPYSTVTKVVTIITETIGERDIAKSLTLDEVPLQ